MNEPKKYTYDYPMFSMAVDILVHYKGNLLFIRRKKEPYKNCLAMPGGFVEIGETCINAAVRELFEETNIKMFPKDLKQFFILDDPNRDVRGRVISMVYRCDINDVQAKNAKGGDDAHEKLEWISVNELHNHNFAFDHIKVIMKHLINTID